MSYRSQLRRVPASLSSTPISSALKHLACVESNLGLFQHVPKRSNQVSTFQRSSRWKIMNTNLPNEFISQSHSPKSGLYSWTINELLVRH